MFCSPNVRLFFAAGALLMITFFPSCKSPEDPDPDVTADEKVYINEVYASGDDWIELYNANPAPVDISGYKIYDDPSNKYTLPQGITIAANDYLIINANDLNTGLNTNFKLTSAGETVYLENKSGNVIDKVTFPGLLNNQSYARIPDGSATLIITGTPTKNDSNADSPSITEVTRAPLIPGLADEVTVSTQFAASADVEVITLFYRFDNGDYQSAPMEFSAGLYHATIPAKNSTGKVDYYIEAKGSSGQSSYRPSDAPEDPYTYLLNTDELPPLFVNEFMALNMTCCSDEAGEFEDWIEIYNAGDEPIDIAGYYLSDDPESPFNSRIRSTNAAETTIPAKGFLVIWADGDRDQGVRHVDFRLNQGGEAVILNYIDGRQIDAYTFGTQTADKSTGRVPNGTGTFQGLPAPSPGASNE